MISLVARGMLLSLGLVLVAGFGARPAAAGATFWGSPNCADPATVASHFTGSYAGFAKCEALCKIAAGMCRGGVKDALSCSKGEAGKYFKAFAVVCSTLTGAEKDACIAQLKSGKATTKDVLANERDNALATCDAFLTTCIPGCSPVL